VENILPPHCKAANLRDYGAVSRSFRWEDANEKFTWSRTGKINIAHEAIDRHAEDPVEGERCCLLYEADNRTEQITFSRMKELSNRFANLLRKAGVRKGDRVFIFLPRCPEYYVAMAGCAKAGAVFGPMFEALMRVALVERLRQGGAIVLVTTPKLASRVPFSELPELRHTILVGAEDMTLKPGELSWEREMARSSEQFDVEWVELSDPLYIVHTYSPSGHPKGVIHAHRDMIGQLLTALWVLDLKADDVLWTTADPGWVTGTVYGTFAPWLCGVGSFVRGGPFTVEGWCRSVEANRVSVLYAAPTLFRRLMAKGEDALKMHDLRSLRHLLSVGEPLPAEVVYWTKRVLKAPVHDTWWMTETGMIMIANYPAMPIKPGSIGRPVPGVTAAVIGADGEELPLLTLGELAIKSGWPSMMTGILRDSAEYSRYFRGPWFVSGDTAYVDEDGYFYYQGRDDDLVKIGGVVVGPSEVEDVLRRHPAVTDAGIIAKPDPLKGNSIKAFVVLKSEVPETEELKQEIMGFVRKHFSSRISPREIEFRPSIPRSKEGRVVRRVLKAWELGLPA
jgi:acetyl-CoA synthetase